MNQTAKPLNKDDYKIPHLNPYRKIVSRMAFSSLFILLPYTVIGGFAGVTAIAFYRDILLFTGHLQVV